MASIYELFETDAAMEQEGIWVNYEDFGKFLVARAGGANKAYQKALEKELRPHRKLLKKRKAALPVDIVSNAVKAAFIETVLLDWQGIKDRKGKAIKFSKENAAKLFEDLPALYEDLLEQSSDHETYAVEEEIVKDDAGN
jgi:hypothetical protein